MTLHYGQPRLHFPQNAICPKMDKRAEGLRRTKYFVEISSAPSSRPEILSMHSVHYMDHGSQLRRTSSST